MSDLINNQWAAYRSVHCPLPKLWQLGYYFFFGPAVPTCARLSVGVTEPHLKWTQALPEACNGVNDIRRSIGRYARYLLPLYVHSQEGPSQYLEFFFSLITLYMLAVWAFLFLILHCRQAGLWLLHSMSPVKFVGMKSSCGCEAHLVNHFNSRD